MNACQVWAHFRGNLAKERLEMVTSSFVSMVSSLVCTFFLSLAFVAGSVANAGIWEKINKVSGAIGLRESANGTVATPSNDEISDGLRQALEVAASKAVEQASSRRGFLKNLDIHIPLPGFLNRPVQLLRKVGMEPQADSIEIAMNKAAEEASSQALPVFTKTIRSMSFEDVQKVWKGGDSAATGYLMAHTRGELYERFVPIVQQAINQVGLVSIYHSFARQPGVEAAINGTRFDLNEYVTNKTLDGLFKLLAQQEKEIRENPAARTTELLKRVFGGH